MRRYDARELARYINFVEKFFLASGTIGDTTLSAAAAIGATSLTVVQIANFTANDPVFIIGPNGTFELNAINGTPSGSSLSLAYPTSRAFGVGVRVVEAQRVDLGAVDEAGISLTGSATIQDVLAATSRLPIASFITGAQLGGGFNLRGMNIPNLQTVFGIPESVQGAGSAASPFRNMIAGPDIGTEGLLCFRGRGTMADGATQFMLDYCGATPAPNLNTQIGGTTPATFGVQFRCQAIVPTIWN